MPANTRIRIFGHEWAQQLLQNVILTGRSSHAYLFAGPDQIGKTTLARAFAQALTCETPATGEGFGACGRCRACRLTADGGHPDHRLILPGNGQIKIDQVRDLIHEASLSPVEGRYKIFIIRGFDRANPNAANALLKTLEEPSATTRILLTSSQSSSLLPTITSRCQVLNLRPLPAQAVAEALQAGWGTEVEQANLLAGLSGGRLGWAVHMATQPDAWQAYTEQLQATRALAGQSVLERLSYAEKLADSPELESILHGWLLWWRDVLLIQQGCPDQIMHSDQADHIRALAQSTQTGEVRRFLQALMTTSSYLRRNVNTRMAVEALLLKAPRAA